MLTTAEADARGSATSREKEGGYLGGGLHCATKGKHYSNILTIHSRSSVPISVARRCRPPIFLYCMCLCQYMRVLVYTQSGAGMAAASGASAMLSWKRVHLGPFTMFLFF